MLLEDDEFQGWSIAIGQGTVVEFHSRMGYTRVCSYCHSNWANHLSTGVGGVVSVPDRLFAHGGIVWKTAHTRVVLRAPQKGCMISR